MKYLVTAREMKEYDENTIDKIGIPGMVLMERAALCVCELLKARFCEDKGGRPDERLRVLVIAGTGNNGGDGLALARLLCEEGFLTNVWCVGNTEKASAQWKAQRSILQNYSVDISNTEPLMEYNIMIDALFGVGLSREVTGDYRRAVEYMNQRKAFKLSLDMPSGVCSDTGKIMGCGVKADMTVTFGFEKRGIRLYPGCEYAGEVYVADVGITERAFFGKQPEMFYYEEEAKEILPKREASGNKGTFGKVLMIAGSINMAGASYLAAKGAYRTGAGMVKLLSVAENRTIIQQTLPDALFGTWEDLESGMKWADVIAIGPGISMDIEAKEVLSKAVKNCRLPIIIDADGLNILAADGELQEELARQGQDGREIILTPHVGELSRLLKLPIATIKEALWDYARRASEAFHCVVVAKDARTFTCAENHAFCMNVRGNSGMAVAGSGDVLCGMIAGLLAQKMSCFEAACIGTHLHGIAGDRAALSRGKHGIMANDIVDSILI